MKKLFVAGAMLASFAAIQSASAADMALKAPPQRLSIAGLDSISAPTLGTVGGRAIATTTTLTLALRGQGQLVIIRYRKGSMALLVAVKSVTIGRLATIGSLALKPIFRAPAKGAAAVSAIPTL